SCQHTGALLVLKALTQATCRIPELVRCAEHTGAGHPQVGRQTQLALSHRFGRHVLEQLGHRIQSLHEVLSYQSCLVHGASRLGRFGYCSATVRVRCQGSVGRTLKLWSRTLVTWAEWLTHRGPLDPVSGATSGGSHQ